MTRFSPREQRLAGTKATIGGVIAPASKFHKPIAVSQFYPKIQMTLGD